MDGKKLIDRIVAFTLLAPCAIAFFVYGSTKPAPHTWSMVFDTRYIMNVGS